MATRKPKTYTYKVSRSLKTFITVFAVIFLIAFLLRFELIAKIVAPVVGMEPEALQSIAGVVSLGAIGTLLVLAGLAISIPVVGTLLLVAGAVILVWTAIKIWNMMNPAGMITGINTDL